MRLETACWVIDSAAAASWNWPASAAATKVRTASRSTPTTVLAQQTVVARRRVGCLIRRGHRCFDPSRSTTVVSCERRCGAWWRDGPWDGSSAGCGRRMRSSAYGSGLGFGAFPLIAVLALHAGPAEVSALSAVGPAVGALIAVPLAPVGGVSAQAAGHDRDGPDPVRGHGDDPGRLRLRTARVSSSCSSSRPWSPRPRSPSTRPAAPTSRPSCGRMTCSWPTRGSSPRTGAPSRVGPPLGGAAIGLFGPVTTVVADALSYLFSALGITAIRGREEAPRTSRQEPRSGPARCSTAGGTSWAIPACGALYLNNMLVAGLIMATEPLLAVLLLRQLGFPPWQYGLAFAAPCVGGLIGSRLARRVVARYGQHRVFRTVGTLRAIWLIGLAFVRPGVVGLVTVMAVELAIIINMSLYSPVLATYRLEHTPQASRRPHPVGLVDRPAGVHRRPHRARRAARRPHQPTHRAHGRGTAHPRPARCSAPPRSRPGGLALSGVSAAAATARVG